MNERDVAAYVAVVYPDPDEGPTLYGPFESEREAELWLSWSLPGPIYHDPYNRVQQVLRVGP